MTRAEYYRKLYREEYKPACDEFIKLYPFGLEDLQGEIWKDILNYEGFYKISNFGRVKSFKFNEPRIMRPELHMSGCLVVRLDNSVWSLRWATGSENQKYAVEMGLKKSGEDNYSAKLTNEQARYIRENPEGLTCEQLAEKFGVGSGAISEIQFGKRYKAAGGKVRTEHNSRKLNAERRNEVRRLYATGKYSQTKLGRMFDVSSATIWNIIHEKE